MGWDLGCHLQAQFRVELLRVGNVGVGALGLEGGVAWGGGQSGCYRLGRV